MHINFIHISPRYRIAVFVREFGENLKQFPQVWMLSGSRIILIGYLQKSSLEVRGDTNGG